MNIKNKSINELLTRALLIVLAMATVGWMSVAEAGVKTVRCGKNDLQKTIDAAASGDTIAIEGICTTNIIIKDKALTLIGASTPGPHGIIGADPKAIEALYIANSLGTVISGLTITNPYSAGVRIRYSSQVQMTDCVVSNNNAGRNSAIVVQEKSYLYGLRLLLENNLRAIGAIDGSYASCDACDLNNNGLMAGSHDHSFITLRGSVGSGKKGIQAVNSSYVDFDCVNGPSASVHACSLTTTSVAGQAWEYSLVGFWGAGDFTGGFFASAHSRVELYGARQMSASNNEITDDSSLKVEPYDDGAGTILQSRLNGNTRVAEFSHALIKGKDTGLSGELHCDSGGDAWVDPLTDLTSFTFHDCLNAP